MRVYFSIEELGLQAGKGRYLEVKREHIEEVGAKFVKVDGDFSQDTTHVRPVVRISANSSLRIIDVPLAPQEPLQTRVVNRPWTAILILSGQPVDRQARIFRSTTSKEARKLATRTSPLGLIE